ncbi:ABC transporter ATP-binding protein [Ureaplasma miroungigenitalium]|uniref:ABC transporter ATP-binding protein n=1 Tax=Ureaplasma miroungigenitalium TaxID=1042321 RepID=A0ABT3BLV7_9BACT|nr:ABC transporter ATP-binding protein [Ureaplasma miroungigenitalium]MCV3728240.1 ABC transporter ATP-binding protein [Ureaplasma miroungigenitalium]MCV3734044.1 ABC transporter ATP-binding protein [Ureaplasma miroungigenitalium]
MFKSKKHFDRDAIVALNPENVIEVRDYFFKYSRRGEFILKDINMNIKNHCFTTILGPNGSGKSTMAKAMVRINNSKIGQIHLYNKEHTKYTTKQASQLIAYIPQSLDIPVGTRVIDYITFGRNPYLNITGILSQKDKDIIQSVMHAMQIEHLKDKFMQDLSGGQRQKIVLALALVQDTPIILLDEPTTYLDIKNQYELLETLKQLQIKHKKTIIAILHDINQAMQFSDYIYVLKDGEVLFDGTPSAIINQESLKAAYNIDASIMQTPNNERVVCNIKVNSYIE